MSALEQAIGGSAIEVVAKATRRRFTGEYKRKIVREADGCKTPGAVGALLRQEGLYSSHLTTWRAARERGELGGASKKRGPARRVANTCSTSSSSTRCSNRCTPVRTYASKASHVGLDARCPWGFLSVMGGV